MTVCSDGGAWIQALRESAHLTQAELAEMVLADVDWIDAVERSLLPVPQPVFGRMARVFGMDEATFAAGFGVLSAQQKAA